MPTLDPHFNFEVIKLLLQAAWADLRLEDEEAQLILGRARKLGLLSDQLARDLDKIRGYLRGDEPLPPPDMGLLKVHRQEVLQAVREVLVCDSKIDQDEKVIWEEICSLLTD